MEKLTLDDIKEYLETKYIGRNIIYLDKATSTNDIAKEMAEKGVPDGLIVIAEEQTKGRGRMGRKWITGKGEALAVSILLRPDIEPNLCPSITSLIALSSVKAIRKVTGFDIMIKWPNDLVLNNRKLGGILTEMTMEGMKVKYIIIGLGLNINQEDFDEDIKNIAVSLKSFSGENFNRRIILSEILNFFERDYEYFKRFGLSYFVEDIKKYSIIFGKEISVIDGYKSVDGTVVDIDKEGGLILKTSDGNLKRIISGDVIMEGLYNIYSNKI
ncbi:BirA family transcriptional regulator, biotin operon repressor / biotin-[acetyl-CoA-carboxylase] ligase [Caloramator quimbayensis]|uniref:biotin--[biotin carboxyl-carrier protein] ligase n=1 Tax=Caloramator quimbayensis TaxID=1147123 RepID=A0A1T4YFU6_9CLOT|nr:biotin--[acetyl-CoA-carboxylase] ligase [Caloramator quimbayensis]SKB00573.1 BirA family transcriptional regulator, biotin operon repressor / biotin-[acetyl-CoA-carboxylase] ligase [Caloramator quimbayensis]